MKPPYERPVIVRHVMSKHDKFGLASGVRPVRDVDGVSVEAMVEEYGSPLFVFSERSLRERIRQLSSELARHFTDYVIAWSYKTNYLGAICRVFHEEGASAEVVSGLEFQKALGLGVPATRIIFNGPAKTREELEVAFREGALVQIDHLDELAMAERVADAMRVEPKVGIRVNVTEVPGARWDRFGFNVENGSAMAAARRVVRGQRLKLSALHCHIGTFVLDPDAYRIEARILAHLSVALAKECGVSIDSIDLGGGFASKNTLQFQYLPGEEVSPSLGQYVDKIAEGLAEGLEGREPPRIILETGRALVDEAGLLVCTVVGNKRLPDGRRAVILDAGVNLLPTAWWYRHSVHPTRDPQGVPEPSVFFGPLCMNIDVMRDAVLFPSVRVGEHIVFTHVGAYNVTQWMQFITERPNVILIAPDGRHSLIRRREGLAALLQQEVMPPWLSA